MNWRRSMRLILDMCMRYENGKLVFNSVIFFHMQLRLQKYRKKTESQPGLYWAVQNCIGLSRSVAECTGRYWAVLSCVGLYWAVLGCTGLHWALPCLYRAVLGYTRLYWTATGLYWTALGCTGLYRWHLPSLLEAK